MTRLIAVAFALTLAASAQAATPIAPLHQLNGLITQARHACGAGMHMVNGVCRTTVMRRQARRCLVWVQGTFAVSGGETVTSQEGCVIQAALEIFAVSQYRGLRSRVVRMC